MKIYSFFAFLILIFCVTSCSDARQETVISDIGDYNNVWTMPERRADETNVLFPSSVNKEHCLSFFCKHTTYRLVGTGWQVSLEIKYDDSAYLSEIDRLNSLCTESPICGTSEHFDCHVYATVWNWNGCFEYAVVDENEKTVCYVYLQLIEKSDLEIAQKHIPKGYEMQMNNTKIYSVYK